MVTAGPLSAILEALIGRRVALPPELLGRFPELHGLRVRRGGAPPRVASWLLRPRGAAAVTLWNVVFLSRRTSIDAELLLHELRHVHQFQGSPTFPVRYLWESLRRGYHRNRFEVDAREFARARLTVPQRDPRLGEP